MGGVFHGSSIVDPHLKRVGFGIYSDPTLPASKIRMAAALNILSGLDMSVTPSYPIIWPANGKTISLTSLSQGEWPDPLTSTNCHPTSPAGAGQPIFLQFGSGQVGSVTSYTLQKGGRTIPTCEIDEHTYTNPQPNLQFMGRNVLHMRGTVVILPLEPLTDGTYSVAITVNGKNYSWSFTVARSKPGMYPPASHRSSE